MCVVHEESPEYYVLQDDLKKKFGNVNEPVFTTDASGLFDLYLENIPDAIRQHYNCNTCKSFINHYGGLVTIGADGKTQSVFWGKGKGIFKPVVKALRKSVESARVTGVFYSDKQYLGNPITGQWMHFAVENHLQSNKSRAVKLQEFKMLLRGLKEYPLNIVEVAVKVLSVDKLHRSEKFLGVANWLVEIHKIQQEVKNNIHKRNLLWRYVANAPIGWCHVKSTMIGSLLDDIKTGYSFDVIKRRFDRKTHPLQYQRPQVAPPSGNIKQAEKLVKEMGIENSFKRRFARLNEIQTFWNPVVKGSVKKDIGIFDHLKAKGERQIDLELPAINITWVKFKREVLSDAKSIQVKVTHHSNPLCALVTATDMDAPPIIQWDFEECRNPVSLYLYHNGSKARDWNLTAGYVNVSALCYRPSMWNLDFRNATKGIIFILEGAKDMRYENSGVALFPEILKSELHQIRATIEAYSKSAVLTGREDSNACGYLFSGRNPIEIKVDGQRYIIDRWD